MHITHILSIDYLAVDQKLRTYPALIADFTEEKANATEAAFLQYIETKTWPEEVQDQKVFCNRPGLPNVPGSKTVYALENSTHHLFFTAWLYVSQELADECVYDENLAKLVLKAATKCAKIRGPEWERAVKNTKARINRWKRSEIPEEKGGETQKVMVLAQQYAAVIQEFDFVTINQLNFIPTDNDETE